MYQLKNYGIINQNERSEYFICLLPGNTTTLIFHLDNEHQDINKNSIGARSSKADPSKAGPVQSTLTSQWSYNSRRPLSKITTQLITQRLTD